MSNEYYSLKPKAEFLSTMQIPNIADFVAKVCEETNIFKFAKSEKNPAPSLNAETVIAGIQAEANYLGVQPNAWLGYNAMNEILHDKFQKTFEVQKQFDTKIFNSIYNMALAAQ